MNITSALISSLWDEEKMNRHIPATHPVYSPSSLTHRAGAASCLGLD